MSIRDTFANLELRPDTPVILAKAIHSILAPVGGMEALDAPFRRYIADFQPLWEEAHRSLSRRGDGWLQVGFPDADATAWSTAPPTGDAYSLTGVMQLLAGEAPQLNPRFARSSAGFLTITFVVGQAPTLYRYVGLDDSWHALASGGESVPAGQPLEFELALSPDGVSLWIDGGLAIETRVAFDPRGAWGLAAHRGSAGHWSELKLTLASPRAATPR